MKKLYWNLETYNEFFEFLNNKFKNNETDFKQYVDECKSIKNEDKALHLYWLLRDEDLVKELFEKLIEDNKLTQDDLKYLWNKIANCYQLTQLAENTTLFKCIVNANLLSIQEFIDKHKSIRELAALLQNKELFEELIEDNILTTEDLKYLLNKIDNAYELYELCHNTSLIKQILKEFVLDEEIVDKFNTIVEEEEASDPEYEEDNVHNIFDLIAHIENYAENDRDIDKDLLELNELNKKVYKFYFSTDQKLKLIEVLRDNEIAQNTLIQIIDNHLESQYDFENLKNLLTKDNEKKKIKMNF